MMPRDQMLEQQPWYVTSQTSPFPRQPASLFPSRTTANNVQTSIIVAAMLFATIASLATASRMLWAFAREKGIPGYTVLVQVSLLSPGSSSNTNQTLLGPNEIGSSNLLYCPNRLYQHPACSHQHRLNRRLQRPHLPRHRRILHLLRHIRMRPPPQTPHNRNDLRPLPSRSRWYSHYYRIPNLQRHRRLLFLLARRS
jgi:hypothetical protein